MAKAAEKGRKSVDTDFPQEDKFDHLPDRPRANVRPTAFLTVQEGCDKFCAFCVVPYTRGAEVSRPAERVLAEARGLVEKGVREITLLGQNVNAYHGAGRDGGTGRWRGWCGNWRASTGWNVSATRHRTPTTWPTT